ncbi:MAG: peptide deformylase [Candidatus Spechtbacteria bacterium]|nr:peptide deformylase [Candidatus Spechtbacteria bacterium]
MIRPVIQEPHPTLRQKAQLVSNFNDPKLKVLLKDMEDTLIQQEGLGLAAPQINESLTIFVIPKEVAPMVRSLCIPSSLFKPFRATIFFNPKLSDYSSKKEIEEEGCLSVRGIFHPLPRSGRVTIEAQNEKGQRFRVTVEGLLARIFQHETDHLNGTLFIDRLHEK